MKVTIKDPNSVQEEYIRSLQRGDFFGEKALQGYDNYAMDFNFLHSFL